eukprot:11830-Heterococcus_DN1.PRE.3
MSLLEGRSRQVQALVPHLSCGESVQRSLGPGGTPRALALASSALKDPSTVVLASLHLLHHGSQHTASNDGGHPADAEH